MLVQLEVWFFQSLCQVLLNYRRRFCSRLGGGIVDVLSGNTCKLVEGRV